MAKKERLEMQWFRMYHEIIDDEKIRLLAFEDRWHYVAILCCKRKGMLDTNSDEQMLLRKLAVKLGLQLRELEELKRRLMEVNLVDENWQPAGWSKRQYESDSSTPRVRDHRERNKQKQGVTG